jgi:phosphate starvation-inducible PhoH-like protein
LTEITIPLRSHDEAIQVLGPYDRNAKLLRQILDIEIFTRGGNLRIRGTSNEVGEARRRVEHLLGKLRKGRELEPNDVEGILLGPDARAGAAGTPRDEGQGVDGAAGAAPVRPPASSWRTDVRGPRVRAVEPRSENQRRYLEAIEENTLTFGVGVAGTGKTFLAVAAAVRRLREGDVRRLIVTRPVVEAGEHLGFLPGDLQAKLNPYMRPVYDALFDLIGFEEARELEEAGVIEVAPLAYMRGRTLANAFVVLDEAQNTTITQMKMFLTRLGEGSAMVVTGDPTQSDLPEGKRSGFMDAVKRLRGQAGISVVEFSPKDIVRHPLVQRIVRAYEGTPSQPERPPGRR